jgi:stalled ribosome rescue protein Dom34
VIEPGDTIEMKVRVKQEATRSARNKKAMQFTNAIVKVESVENGEEALAITGQYTSELGAGRTRCWLTDGENFVLFKVRWTRQQIAALIALRQPKSPGSSPTDSPGNSAMEHKAMAKFDQLAATDWDLLTYGLEYVFCALDAGAAEAVVLTDALLKRQNNQRQTDLGNPSKKFRGADVIVVTSDSPHFQRVSQYGGAVAILKYAFDAASCL